MRNRSELQAKHTEEVPTDTTEASTTEGTEEQLLNFSFRELSSAFPRGHRSLLTDLNSIWPKKTTHHLDCGSTETLNS
jgi:hypothetical protein